MQKLLKSLNWQILKDVTFRRSLSEISILTSGNLLSSVITIICYPILSRLYTQAEFGEFALFQSTFIVLLPLTTFNYEEAIVLISSRKKLNHLLSGLLITILITVLMVSIFVLLKGFTLIGIQLPVAYLWLLPAILGIGGIGQIINFLLLQKKTFKLTSITKVTERISFQLSAILIGLSQLTYNGLITAMLSGQLLSMLIAAPKAFQKFRFTWQLKAIQKTLVTHKSFPLYSLTGGFLERLSRNMPVFLLSALSSEAITGQYAIAYKILSLPEIILGVSIGQLFYVRASERFLKRQKLKPLIIKVWTLQLIAGFLPLLILLFFGETIFSLILGDNWIQAGEIARIIAIMMFILFITVPASYTLNVLKKQHVDLQLGIVTLISRTTILVVGLKYFSIYKTLLLLTITESCILIAFNVLLFHYITQWDRQVKVK